MLAIIRQLAAKIKELNAVITHFPYVRDMHVGTGLEPRPYEARRMGAPGRETRSTDSQTSWSLSSWMAALAPSLET